MFVSKNSKYPIGLDISDLNLKLVQLNKTGNKIKIQAIGKCDLPKGAIENGEIKDKQAVITAINQLLSKPKFGAISGNRVVACLPETKIFIKLIEIEKSPNNLADIIGPEIEKYIPVSSAEIYYDWQIIEEKSDSYLVLLGVAPKNIVDQYIDLLKDTKLLISALEIESTAICRCLLNEESPKFAGTFNTNYGIIDIGAKRTSMIIYSGNTIVITVSMPISGEDITNRISTTLEISKEQAEKAKIICGLDKNSAQGIISDILSDMINELIAKINDTLDFYNEHYGNLGPINKIILCGGGANVKDLEKIIKEAISIDTELANPFTNIAAKNNEIMESFRETHELNISDKNIPDKVQTKKQDMSLSYITAIGLALRDIFINKT